MAQNQLGREGLSDPKRSATLWSALKDDIMGDLIAPRSLAEIDVMQGSELILLPYPLSLPPARQTFKVASGGLCNRSRDKLLASFGSTVQR